MRKFFLMCLLTLLPAMSWATLIAPDGIPQPEASYTVFKYKNKVVDLYAGEGRDVNFANFANINFHGDETHRYKLVYDGCNETDTVSSATLEIYRNTKGKMVYTFYAKVSTVVVGSDSQGYRDLPLKLIDSDGLNLVEHGELTLRIYPPPTGGARTIGFTYTEGSFTLKSEKAENKIAVGAVYFTLYGNQSFPKGTTIEIDHNDYPNLKLYDSDGTTEIDTVVTFTESDCLRRRKQILFTIEYNSKFINQNLHFYLRKIERDNVGYEITPGRAVLDVEVIDPDAASRVEANLYPRQQPAILAGETVNMRVEMDGPTGALPNASETDFDVTLDFPGKFKYPDDVEIISDHIVVPDDQKKNQITINVKGQYARDFKIRPLVNPQKAGITEKLKVRVVKIRPANKEDFFKSSSHKYSSWSADVNQPIARKAVAWLPYPDTAVIITVPDAALKLSNYVDSPAGKVRRLSDNTLSYDGTGIVDSPKLHNGFIDVFNYIILNGGKDHQGEVRLYAGKPVARGSSIELNLDAGTFINAPKVRAFYYDPVTDPYEIKKSPKQATLKLVAKPNKNKSDTQLVFLLPKTPLLYSKADLKKYRKEHLCSTADALPAIQKTYAGMELVMSWKQEKEGNYNFVNNLKDSSFGAVLVCAPATAADTPLTAVGAAGVDTALVAEKEYMLYGMHFGNAPKVMLEYKQNGSVKQLKLKTVKTPKDANPADYTDMDPDSGASNLRFLMPKQTKLDALKTKIDAGTAVYLVLDNTAGLTTLQVTLP